MEKIKNVSKVTELRIYTPSKMIDFEKLSEKEPELFNELCEDYPLADGVYMIVNKDEKK